MLLVKTVASLSVESTLGGVVAGRVECARAARLRWSCRANERAGGVGDTPRESSFVGAGRGRGISIKYAMCRQDKGQDINIQLKCGYFERLPCGL